jgi:type III restriction enzyme
MVTLEKLIERDYQLPEVQTSQEVIAYYAKRIAQDVKLPAQFAALVPKVREFLQTRAFGEPVNLDDPVILKAIATNVAQYVAVQTFVKALRPLVVQELEPQLLSAGRKLSETPPFPYSRPTVKAAKTVFNLVPCANKFEQAFAEFLEDAPDITAFSKLPEQFGFVIEYTDATNNLRYYEPDFVAIASNGVHYVIETKGREDVDVANKDHAATLWCENATRLTSQEWRYVKVPQKEYEELHPDEFSDVLVFAQTPML